MIDYEIVKECVEDIDASISLITTMDDSSLGEAIDRLVAAKAMLSQSLDAFEDNLEAMSEYYEE